MIETGLCFLIANVVGSIVYLLIDGIQSHLIGEEYTQLRHDLYHVMVMLFLGLFVISWVVNLWLLYTPGLHNWGAGSPVMKWFFTILTGIWLLGAVARLLYYVYYRVYHDSALRSRAICDQSTRKISQELCDQLGIRKRPVVIQGYGSIVPELIGYGKPVIYLPGDVTYTEGQLRGIIAHELYHYKHHDKWVRELAIVTHCIGWFNPILAKLNRKVEFWDEAYCDYAVVNAGILAPKEYAHVIYNAAEKVLKWSRPGESFIAIGVCENGKNLKERVKRVLHYQGNKKQKVGSLAALTVLMILTTCVTALAAGTGTLNLVEKANEITMEGYEEAPQIREVLTEYTAMADETEWRWCGGMQSYRRPQMHLLKLLLQMIGGHQGCFTRRPGRK